MMQQRAASRQPTFWDCARIFFVALVLFSKAAGKLSHSFETSPDYFGRLGCRLLDL
jgi:hypothetical protein